MQLEVKIEKPSGKKAFCCNYEEILAEGKRRGLSIPDMSKLAKIPEGTIRNWSRNFGADPVIIQRLVNYLNETDPEKKVLQ